MKLLLTISISIFLITSSFANSFESTFNEKKKKTEKSEAKASSKESNNFHTVKRWKITITYTNGDILVKSISVKGNSKVSAMETAFSEAENYLKRLDNVEGYSVAPLANNEFFLLAEK
ncbi:hypothetical protein ACJRPK_05710 [Aquimarina sp. 2-A2]|uniref:hypothetical protein n=1 Tax=Aquimarina sp. 2-A2 TaxID=3382644 RepID=UPI00387EF220